jgi:penicillin-binding protein 1A
MAKDTKSARRRRPGRGRRIVLGTLFAFLLVIVALLATLAGFYVAVARSLPSLELAGDISSTQTSKIYDDSQSPVLLAELHGLENRDVLQADQISQVMRDAVVAIEDERFYQHSGVDFVAILRALWADVRHRQIVQGGSTITQQLIKNAYINDDQTLDRKLREAALAYQLEKKWSKEKILNEYLNIVYFGEGAYGVGAAARTYFGVNASDLTIAQAALLAGLPKAPSALSPRRDPEAALARRDLVLNKMYQQKYITSKELQQALSASLKLAAPTDEDSVKVPYWVEMVREQLVSRYGSSTVLGGGLRVYTSVDLVLQQEAEDAIAGVLNEVGDPAAALVCIDVRTGRLVAMVGGADFKTSQFNLATQGRRQPGSAFKPFVLVTALKQGMSPDATYDSGPITIDLPSGPWDVSSTDEGALTLAEATARSSNGVYARLVMDLGAAEVAKTAYEMGIVTSVGKEPNPAIALGGLTTGVSPLEMAMAYATLATGGERLSSLVPFAQSKTSFPVVIVRVTDSAGKVLDQNGASRTRVLDPGVAAIATSCLQLVIASGTGTAADIGRPAAGKTGTTQNYRDAWFVGYTPELVTAVWVGYPNEQKAMTDVHGIKVTGGSFPARIWAGFMKEALKGTPASAFPALASNDWVSVAVCSESRLLPTKLCPTLITELFRADKQPTESCTIHVPTDVTDVVGLMLAEAEKILETAGFKVTAVDDATSLAPAGTVTDQSPAPGTEVLHGATLTLTVSVAPPPVVVPALAGLDVAAARLELAALGLVGEETATSDPALVGTVLSQDPAAGTEVLTGATVRLVVSSGPVLSPSP